MPTFEGDPWSCVGVPVRMSTRPSARLLVRPYACPRVRAAARAAFGTGVYIYACAKRGAHGAPLRLRPRRSAYGPRLSNATPEGSPSKVGLPLLFSCIETQPQFLNQEDRGGIPKVLQERPMVSESSAGGGAHSICRLSGARGAPRRRADGRVDRRTGTPTHDQGSPSKVGI